MLLVCWQSRSLHFPLGHSVCAFSGACVAVMLVVVEVVLVGVDVVLVFVMAFVVVVVVVFGVGVVVGLVTVLLLVVAVVVGCVPAICSTVIVFCWFLFIHFFKKRLPKYIVIRGSLVLSHYQHRSTT